ncbi:MAG: DUF554 domain-containing protein [Candidatus Nanopelagicales bacterium]|nr:DUF554 domain-containing protein [Candidatus Nanopelagicales bacterium]
MVGLGTILNVAAIAIGSLIGIALGNRLPERTRAVVTDSLGMLVLVIAALNIMSLRDQAWVDAVGGSATLLIILGSLIAGGIIGSLLRIETRMEALGGWLQSKFSSGDSSAGRARFIEGFVDASLIFCIGPLAILGALSDGLGLGIDQLALKSALDGFASIAFAATMGWGVLASALAVGIYQGAVTVISYFAGAFLTEALVASITATGGVLLIGVGLRVLRIKSVAVGDLLPALIIAPLLTLLVANFV